MKKLTLFTTFMLLGLGLAPVFGQFGAGGGGAPNLGGSISKLFGANQTFSANVEIHAASDNGDITMPGKVYFDTRKARFQFNMSEMQGTRMPPATLARMKEMGMDSMISISRPDLKVSYVVYPGLNSYLEVPVRDTADTANPDDYKVETTELAKETVDGHDCVKNKVTVTAPDGTKNDATVWNATDLKDFPIKITTDSAGRPATIMFKDITFTKPAASLFDPPAGLTKYSNMQTMMQTEMMKKMGNGGGMPPPAGQNGGGMPPPGQN
jgi:hypothetical protein